MHHDTKWTQNTKAMFAHLLQTRARKKNMPILIQADMYS